MHKRQPDRRRHPAAGLAFAQRHLIVESYPYTGDDLGRIADEPGVVEVVGGARLARRRAIQGTHPTPGAILHDALEHAGNGVGHLRTHDALRRQHVRFLNRSIAVDDPGNEHRLGMNPLVGEHAVEGGDVKQRHFRGPQGQGQHTRQLAAYAEPAGIGAGGIHANFLQHVDGRQIARLGERQTQRDRSEELLVVVFRSPRVRPGNLAFDRVVRDLRGRVHAGFNGRGVYDRLER